VEVPKLYNPLTSLLLPPEQKNLWQGMKTVGQLKRENGMHSDPAIDSLYRVCIMVCDVNLLGNTVNTIMKNAVILLQASADICLELNVGKRIPFICDMMPCHWVFSS
jgi:hypothetical protein